MDTELEYLRLGPAALRVERRQLADAGRPVEEVADEFDAVLADAEAEGSTVDQGRARRLLDRCESLPDPDTDEPTALGAVRAARPQGPRTLDVGSWDAHDALKGAWTGRCVGCRLGKPVETWTREEIDRFLSATDQSLDGYLRADVQGAEGFDLDATGGWDDRVEGVPRDDDIDFTLAALTALGHAGETDLRETVARTWVDQLPAGKLHTAERVAYRNVLQAVDETARRHNPYREFVGAQIRGDCYGYVSPGRPERAAGLAYRDATVSHVRNGVYGAMWIAALLASVPAVEGLRRAVRVGLTEVPEASRFANCVTEVLDWHAAGASYETAVDRIHAEWDDADRYEGYHVLPNAQVVAATLVWAGEDPDVGTALRRAVSAGFDTDCNAATVGSAVGLRVGHDRLPEQWVRPTSVGVRTALADRPRPELDDLAVETAALANA